MEREHAARSFASSEALFHADARARRGGAHPAFAHDKHTGTNAAGDELDTLAVALRAIRAPQQGLPPAAILSHRASARITPEIAKVLFWEGSDDE